MNRRSLLGACIGTLLGTFGLKRSVQASVARGDNVDAPSDEKRYSICLCRSYRVIGPDKKPFCLWVFALEQTLNGTGTIEDWLRLVPVTDKFVVFTEPRPAGKSVVFLGLYSPTFHGWIDIPVKADRWSWDSGQRDRLLLGLPPDGKPQFLEAYHLRDDEQIENVLDMQFPDVFQHYGVGANREVWAFTKGVTSQSLYRLIGANHP